MHRYFSAGDYSEQITAIHIGAGITEISTLGTDYKRNLFFPNVQNYVVDAENIYYASENGGLFNKDKTQILIFPRARTGSYKYVFEECENLTDVEVVADVWEYMFYKCPNVKNVNLKEGVTKISQYAFPNTYFENIHITKNIQQRQIVIRCISIGKNGHHCLPYHGICVNNSVASILRM